MHASFSVLPRHSVWGDLGFAIDRLFLEELLAQNG
jgi:hypothetical protein